MEKAENEENKVEMDSLNLEWKWLSSCLQKTFQVDNIQILSSDEKNGLKLKLEKFKSLGFSKLIQTWYFETFKQTLVKLSFWNIFEKGKQEKSLAKLSPTLQVSHFTHLKNFLQNIEESLVFIEQILEIQISFLERFKSIYQIILFSNSHSQLFQEVLYLFFSRHFQQSNSENSSLEKSEDENEDLSTEPISDSIFRQFCLVLYQLSLMDFAESVFTEILFQQIEFKIKTLCLGNFQEKYLVSILKWLDQMVFPWLNRIICNSESESNQSFSSWRNRIEFFTFKEFGKLRIKELFDIIIDFPDSTAAVEDLRDCLGKTNEFGELTNSLKQVLSKRLLHPGAITSDIITQYISTIKVLRIIDPSGVTLDKVSEPIQQYLRGREDTIRCIVSSCTEDPSSELFEELANSEEKNDALLTDEAESDDESAPWEPDPVDALPTNRFNKKSDIISMLVNIYGSSELFVSEYRNMLADRLLSILDYETEKEIHILELFKLRFGESNLHNCEIMIKDISDSKRNNNSCTKVNPNQSDDFPLDVTCISYLFWPTFRNEENISLAPQLQAKMEEYQKNFQILKPNRSLNWKSHLGTVVLDLNFEENKTISFSVTPLQATIILYFQDQETWQLEELAEKIEVSSDFLKKKISFWVNQGIIKEIQRNQFQLLKTPLDKSEKALAEEDEDSSLATSTGQSEEDLQMRENFVMGMLRTFGTMTIDGIFSMLSNHLNSNLTLPELRTFLQKLAKEDKLNLSGREYSIKT